MNVIRDGSGYSIYMTALLIDWNIRRCNQKGCTKRPNTIIGGGGDSVPVFGLCEEHYQMGNVPDGYTFNLEIDNFDAFKQEEQQS